MTALTDAPPDAYCHGIPATYERPSGVIATEVGVTPVTEWVCGPECEGAA